VCGTREGFEACHVSDLIIRRVSQRLCSLLTLPFDCLPPAAGRLLRTTTLPLPIGLSAVSPLSSMPGWNHTNFWNSLTTIDKITSARHSIIRCSWVASCVFCQLRCSFSSCSSLLMPLPLPSAPSVAGEYCDRAYSYVPERNSCRIEWATLGVVLFPEIGSQGW
jgi:hypothetical protein